MELKARKIVHVDMDAFYAAVEQMDQPRLKGKPVIVGGTTPRGVVSAASYEARKFGVRSAMPTAQARKLCPNGVFLSVRMKRYREVSRQVFEIFREYTDLIEPLSLDEAFLDVTENKKGIPLASEVAREIKKRIRNEVGLTASAGVGPNKFIAKLASDHQKPDGLVVVPPERVQDFIRPLRVSKILGVGKVGEKRLTEMGIETIADLQAVSREKLVAAFGKMGGFLYFLARGEDTRAVSAHRERKSLSRERTFERDLNDLAEIREVLKKLCGLVMTQLERTEFEGSTVILKVKYHDFRISTRSRTLPQRVRSERELLEVGNDLLEKTQAGNIAIRLLGIGVARPSRREPEDQLTLFD